MVRYLKSGMILVTAALLAGSSAQQQSDTTDVDTTGRDGARAPGRRMPDSTMALGMMMHMMKPSTVFETSDGFIVIVGNRIIKYDNNLNMVRQAEIPIDTTAMKEMMKRMDLCPSQQQEEDNGGESDTTMEE